VNDGIDEGFRAASSFSFCTVSDGRMNVKCVTPGGVKFGGAAQTVTVFCSKVRVDYVGGSGCGSDGGTGM
jgi:hypothetical protein